MPISIANRQAAHPIDLRRLRRSLKRLLKKMGIEDAEISLLLVDDQQIMEFNSVYLKRNRPTNVISFAMAEGEFGNINPHTLGDIIVSTETAFRDAATGHIDFMDELEFLVIHGMLHLLGYNHEGADREEAEKMAARQNELFFFLRGYTIE